MNVWKHDTESFKKKAKEVHPAGLDFYYTIFVSQDKKVDVLCPLHGRYQILPSNLVYMKTGCPTCGKKRSALAHRKDQLEFITECRFVHDDKYTYEKTVYTGSANDVLITCKDHGVFPQKAGNHRRGDGCPHCHDYVYLKPKDYHRTKQQGVSLTHATQSSGNVTSAWRASWTVLGMRRSASFSVSFFGNRLARFLASTSYRNKKKFTEADYHRSQIKNPGHSLMLLLS